MHRKPLGRKPASLRQPRVRDGAFFGCGRKAPSLTEAGRFSDVPEQRTKTRPIKAQSTAIARAIARICNAERVRFGVVSGHERKTPSLSGQPGGELGCRHTGGAEGVDGIGRVGIAQRHAEHHHFVVTRADVGQHEAGKTVPCGLRTGVQPTRCLLYTSRCV